MRVELIVKAGDSFPQNDNSKVALKICHKEIRRGESVADEPEEPAVSIRKDIPSVSTIALLVFFNKFLQNRVIDPRCKIHFYPRTWPG